MELELEEAVIKNDLMRVRALLSAGVSPNSRTRRQGPDIGASLLHFANSVEIVKELVSYGAWINFRNSYKEIPLHTAIKRGRTAKVVRELLKHGADVDATDRKGNTPLNLAVKLCAKYEIINELLEYGADINIRDREHNSTPLDNAIFHSCYKLLIKIFLIKNFEKDYRKIINIDSYKKRAYSELSSYLNDCVCEIVQMKTDEIKDGLTLYKFVTNNYNRDVLCNNALSVRLSKIDYSIQYPIYNDIILDKISERADLLNKLSKIQIYTNLDTLNEDKVETIILDHDSAYNITEYLSNEDLLNLIVAFDDANKLPIQSLSSLYNRIEPDRTLDEISASNDAKRARLS